MTCWGGSEQRVLSKNLNLLLIIHVMRFYKSIEVLHILAETSSLKIRLMKWILNLCVSHKTLSIFRFFLQLLTILTSGKQMLIMPNHSQLEVNLLPMLVCCLLCLCSVNRGVALYICVTVLIFTKQTGLPNWYRPVLIDSLH